MRTSLLSALVVVGMSVPGCRCSPAEPVAITMKVVNTTKDPIYVDERQHRLGLAVGREVAGQVYPFDDLACVCDFCANVCSACDCPDAGPALVRRIEPGAVAERSWDGVVQVSGTSACGDCLDQENAPLNESFALRLCYQQQKPLGVLAFDDGGVAPGRVEAAGLTCTEKRFMLQDGLVEIGPERGASCATTSECPGAGELCFDGSCTTGCPANDFPAPTSANLWLKGDLGTGFFTESTRVGAKVLTGTGTVTNVTFETSHVTTVYLSRSGSANEALKGTVKVTLPALASLPLAVGAKVSVVYLDNGEEQEGLNRAVMFRDAATGQLLFAADMAQGGSLLTAADLAPLVVASGSEAVGCRVVGACGKHVYFTRRLSLGAVSTEVEPGQRGTLESSGGRWTILSVSNGAFPTRTDDCPVADMRPWVVWRL